MCAECKELKERLESLESFVWEHAIANECDHNSSGICTLFGDEEIIRCNMEVCTEDMDWKIR